MKQILIAILFVSGAAGSATPQAQRPPLSKDEVMDWLKRPQPQVLTVRAIRQFGIAFDPTDEVLDQFQEEGADDGVLAALLAAGPPQLKAPLAEGEILTFVAKGASGESGVRWVRRHGIDFQPTEDFLSKLRAGGAKDGLLSELHATTPRPWSTDELVHTLSGHKDIGELEQNVRQRGIDFAPDAENLAALRDAGASEAILQAVRSAKRCTPFTPLFSELTLPNPNATSRDWEGKEATLFCTPPDLRIDVLADPNDLRKTVGVLQCGERVTFLEKDSGRVGVDKIRYADGKVGYVADHYFGGATSQDRYTQRFTEPPHPIYKPDPPYTAEGRQRKVQGRIAFQVAIDEHGDVTEVKETSRPLGYGMDEMASRVIKTWRFSPATSKGAPVATTITVEIAFRLFK